MKLDTKSNPNAAQVRLEPASPSKTAGQRKHELRIGRQPEYVDTDRSHLNRVLIEPQTAATMRKRAVERRDRKPRKRAMKSNAAVSFSGIITFGHLAHLRFERLTTEQQDAAFLDLAHAVAERHKAGLTGLVVHCDEAGLHAHFQLDAYDEAGNALSDTVKRADLRAVQDLTGEIMGRHCPGIERGHSKVERLKAGAAPADVVYKKPAEMRRRLAADLEQAEKARADLDTEREKLAARVAKLQAYGDELTEKGAKQLETAQRRLEAKEAAIRDLDAQEVKLRQSATEAATAAQRAAERVQEAQGQEQAVTARLEPLRAAVAALDAHEAAEKARERAARQAQAESGQFEALLDLFAGSIPRETRFGPMAAWVALERDEDAAEVRSIIKADVGDGPMKIRQRLTQLDTREFQSAVLKTQMSARAAEYSQLGYKVRDSRSWSDLLGGLDEWGRRLVDKISRALSAESFTFKHAPPPPQAKPAADLPPELRQALRDTLPKGPTR